MKVGEYRLIPKGTKFWSIKNQTTIMTDSDEIVEIKHTCYGNDVVFVEPKQLLFNMMGFFPTLIERGSDEWEISYSETLPYKIPEPKFLEY
jgi:hypothetical protein